MPQLPPLTPGSREYLGNRRNAAYRHVLFNHIGKVSSLRDAPSNDFPGCYTPLVSPVVFEAEAFNPRACPNDDVWPCDRRSEEVSVVDFEKLCAYKV